MRTTVAPWFLLVAAMLLAGCSTSTTSEAKPTVIAPMAGGTNVKAWPKPEAATESDESIGANELSVAMKLGGSYGFGNSKDGTLEGKFGEFKAFTDDDVKELVKLKRMNKLTISGTKFTDVGLEQLTALTNLKILNLNSTGVTQAGVGGLQKALPQCKIVRK
jgi:hypothetical protein